MAVGDIATASNWNILANNETFLLPGTLIQRTQYVPASNGAYTVAASTMTALDATNLSVVFTVPSTGNVIFRWHAVGQAVYGGAQGSLYGGIWSTTAAASVGNPKLCFSDVPGPTTGSIYINMEYACLVTGLTPGASLQWSPAAYYLNNGGTIIYGNYGPFLVEVFASS